MTRGGRPARGPAAAGAWGVVSASGREERAAGGGPRPAVGRWSPGLRVDFRKL